MNEVVIYKEGGTVQNVKAMAAFLNSLPNGKFLITAKNIRRRSLPQNAYLHGVVIPLVYEGLRDAGFSEIRDHEDAKKVIKSLFLKQKIVNPNTGEVITEIIKDTHELTTSEMIAFIDDVVMWSAEYLSITIPEPMSQTKLFAV